MNYYVLLVFAPLLVLIGIAGFLIPKENSLTSGAPAYNIFHIVFGIIGLLTLIAGGGDGIRIFNIAFGVIDLYQAAASYFHLFPENFFRWTRADDVLHIVIGLILIGVGLVG